eukprot:8405144-Ditylum_brightwellii.AAC.1
MTVPWSGRWYIGPSPNHYRCLRCYIPATTAKVDADTLHLIPHNIPIPSFSDKEALNQALHDIICILKTSEISNIPQFWKSAPIQQAFQQVVALLGQNTARQPIIPPTIPPVKSP